MILFSTPIVMLVLLCMMVLHALSVLLKGMIAKIVVYVNIGLHILMMLPMVYKQFTIEEAVLVYMISVFSYTLISYIKYIRGQRAEAESPEPVGVTSFADELHTEVGIAPADKKNAASDSGETGGDL